MAPCVPAGCVQIVIILLSDSPRLSENSADRRESATRGRSLKFERKRTDCCSGVVIAATYWVSKKTDALLSRKKSSRTRLVGMRMYNIARSIKPDDAIIIITHAFLILLKYATISTNQHES